MRLTVVALVAALSVASASQTWLQAAGYPEPTETVREKDGSSTVTRKYNPICSDSGRWKNDDAHKKEDAVREYRAAQKKFAKKTDEADEKLAALLKERNELESKAVTLRLSLTSLEAAFGVEDEKANALLGERDEAAKNAREASATTKATGVAIRSLNRTIESLQDSIKGIRAEEERTEGRVTAEAGKLIKTIKSFGKAETEAKSVNIGIQESIESSQGDVDTVSSRLDALAKAVADVALERNATLRRVAEIRERRAQLSAQRRAIEKEVRQLEADITKHAADLDRANELKHKAEADAARAQSDELEASQKASSAERKVGMMESEKGALEARLAEDKGTMGEAVAAVKALADRRKDIQQRLDALGNASAELREKEESLVDAHEAIRGNASVVAEQLAAVRGRLSAATVDAVRAETVAAAHRTRRDAEAGLGRAASAAIQTFRHRATVRHAQFVKNSAQGLLGECDCAADADGCDKCGPGTEVEDQDLTEPPSAGEVLQGAEPVPGPDGGVAEFAASASEAASFANGASDPLRSDEEIKDADAVTRASAMVAQTATALERARGTVVAAARAQGSNLTDSDAAAMETGQDLAVGSSKSDEMSTPAAVELASTTEAQAKGARSRAEHAIDVAEGNEAARDELAAASIAAGTPTDSDETAAEPADAIDALDAQTAETADDEAAPAADAIDALDAEGARFRQRRSAHRSLRGQAVLSSGRANSTTASNSSSNATAEADPMAGLKWSAKCTAYSRATDRLNKAAAEFAAATHVVKIAEVKFQRTVAQRDAALKARDASRAGVDALAEKVSDQQAAVRKARARVTKLREQLEGIQASIKEAMSGLDNSQARVQAMESTKEDLSLAERSERRSLDRATTQESRVQAMLEKESAKLEAERAAAEQRTASLKGVLSSLREDYNAKQQRVDELLREQQAEADALAAAEKAEDDARAGAETDSKDVDESSAMRDEKAAHETAVEAEIKLARTAEERSEEAASAAKASVQTAEGTLARMHGEARRLRGALEQAKAAVQGTSSTHALAEADGFSLEIAVRKLQDRMQSKQADVDGLKARLGNLARETKAFHQSVETADETIAALEGEEEGARHRGQEAKKLVQSEAKAAEAAEADKLAKEAELNALAKKRGMAPPGTMQELDEAQARRAVIEAAVGGANAKEAEAMVSTPFEAPPAPADPDAQADASSLAAVDPAVDEVLAEAEHPGKAAQDAADAREQHEADKAEEEEEAEAPPVATGAAASAEASARDDAAAIEKAEADALVKPEDLPGATGDPATDSISDPNAQPPAESVDEIKPAPAAGGPTTQDMPSAPTPGGGGGDGDEAGGAAPGGMGGPPRGM